MDLLETLLEMFKTLISCSLFFPVVRFFSRIQKEYAKKTQRVSFLCQFFLRISRPSPVIQMQQEEIPILLAGEEKT